MTAIMVLSGVVALIVGAGMWRYRDAAARFDLDVKRSVYPHLSYED